MSKDQASSKMDQYMIPTIQDLQHIYTLLTNMKQFIHCRELL
jgi:hypothetical protein